MPSILYSDLNCPFCWALEERLLEHELESELEWRGVQHAPELPAPMARAAGPFAMALAGEVRAVERLAPGLGIRTPPGKPNTARAIATLIAARRVAPEAEPELRIALHRALWRQGADTSDPGVLRERAVAAGIPNPAVTAEDETRLLDWHREWQQAGLTAVPALVRDDGETLVGLTAPEALEDFLRPQRPATR